MTIIVISAAATVGVTMAIPANAFVWRDQDAIQPGEMFLFEGLWWLRVMAVRGNNSMHARLQLTGEQAGLLVASGAGSGKALAVTGRYTWAPTLKDPTSGNRMGNVMASLSVTQDGPTLWGSFGHQKECCFLLDGTDVTNTGIADFDAIRFQHWDAVLVGAENPDVRIANLFSVDRS